MSIRKPPVSASIGIEIKPPKEVSFSGDTSIAPRNNLNDRPKTSKVHINLGSGIVLYAGEFNNVLIVELVKEWSLYGYTHKDRDGLTHYPPHRIYEIEILPQS